MRLRQRTILAGTLLTLQLLGACSSWRVQSTPLPTYLAETRPSETRLWLRDSIYVDVRAPQIIRDSVVSGDNAPAIALSDVTRFAVKRADALKTAVFLGLVTVGVLATLGVFGSLGSGASLGSGY